MGTLRVRNLAQKVLWDWELNGQISDGRWENSSPSDHWEYWAKAEVVVDPENVGRDFYARRDGYCFTEKSLLEIIGERMLNAVRSATSNPEYSEKDMITDLRDLRKIIKLHVHTDRPVPPQPKLAMPLEDLGGFSGLPKEKPVDSLNYGEACDSCAAEAGELCLPSCEGNGDDAPERTFTMADFDTAAKS